MVSAGSDGSPRVSVIIPTYNRSDVLRYAVESVLWQTFADFELLVIGDGCTDDTAAVVASFGDPRIHWHNVERNVGNQWLPNNTGIAMARGDFIAYLGHDDLWLPDHLLHLVRAIERTYGDIAYSLAEMVGPPETGFRMLMGLSPSGEYEKALAFPICAMLHTRACIAAIGGWRDHRTLHTTPDNDLLYRFWAADKRFVPTNELTAIVFLSHWRRDIYRVRRADEQAAYAARIRTERDFVSRELLAILSSYIWERGVPVREPIHTDNLPRGWTMQHLRQVRGLAPNAAPDNVAFEARELHEIWRTARDFRWLDWREGRSAFVPAENQPNTYGPPEQARVTPVEMYEGYHDEFAPYLISGWARNAALPDIPVTIDVYEGQWLLGTIIADLFRQDLRDAGIGSGQHGFNLEVPHALCDGQPHAITLRIAGTDIALAGTPKIVIASGDTANVS